jgi:hypothetical protein
MQLPNAVATKSVGEKASPLPWLSTGASVTILLPDDKCVAMVRKLPSYKTVEVMFFVLKFNSRKYIEEGRL